MSGERDMSDLLEETISLSDITEITDYRQSTELRAAQGRGAGPGGLGGHTTQ